MDSEFGTTLPQRPRMAWLALGLGGFGTLVALALFARATEGVGVAPGALAAAVGVGLVLVVMPFWFAWSFRRTRFHVSSSTATRTTGGRVTRQVRFADLTQVHVVLDASFDPAMPERFNKGVVLIYQDRGRKRWIRVTREEVTTLAPLLAPVAAEVRRRPDLVKEPRERALLLHYLDAGL